jgi:hypothetical protein
MTTAPTVPTVTQQPVPRTHVPLADHALKAHAIQKDRAARAAGSVAATVQLLFAGLDADAMQELLLLKQSAWSRLAALRTGWIQDWTGWLRYADQIKGANTMSKLFEMEANILAQATQILGRQVTSLVALQENLEVDYAYLINQILAAQRFPDLDLQAALRLRVDVDTRQVDDAGIS